MDLQQPTGLRTNAFGYDLPREMGWRADVSRSLRFGRSPVKRKRDASKFYLTGRDRRLTNVTSPLIYGEEKEKTSCKAGAACED
jgi:hypothetical protein